MVPLEVQEDKDVIFGAWLQVSDKGTGHHFLYHYVLYRIVVQLERNGTLRTMPMNHSSYTEIIVHYKYMGGCLTYRTSQAINQKQKSTPIIAS